MEAGEGLGRRRQGHGDPRARSRRRRGVEHAAVRRPVGTKFANTTTRPPRTSAAPACRGRAGGARVPASGSRIGRTGRTGWVVGASVARGRCGPGHDDPPGLHVDGTRRRASPRPPGEVVARIVLGLGLSARARRRVTIAERPPIARRNNRITRKREAGRFPSPATARFRPPRRRPAGRRRSNGQGSVARSWIPERRRPGHSGGLGRC